MVRNFDEFDPKNAGKMQKMIEQAKLRVIRNYEHCDETQRKWLEASLDASGTIGSRVSLFVLSGNPVKGYIIANYGTETVIAFGCFDMKLKTYTSPEKP